MRLCADYGTDLLVMGGYGHSRFREFLLGGCIEDGVGAQGGDTFLFVVRKTSRDHTLYFPHKARAVILERKQVHAKLFNNAYLATFTIAGRISLFLS